ncbi:MAG: YlxR family protein [Dehalococcoidia bacterium]|nr:YlxR family protein [Dehalococcoidia bacterium]
MPSTPDSQPRRQPQRTCIACRNTGDKRGLTRLIRTADGRVRVDPGSRLPGRGAYLCGQHQCWERALGRGDLLGRALRATLTPEDRDALLAGAPAASLPSEAAVESVPSTNELRQGERP